MGQFKWVFLDDFNRRYDVGIYHGDSSGNVVIHCNGNIILIDFGVLVTKKYSFFLNENLCEIEMEKEDQNFFYTFEVNEKADTPLNRARKIYNRKIRNKLILYGILYFATLISIIAWMMTTY